MLQLSEAHSLHVEGDVPTADSFLARKRNESLETDGLEVGYGGCLWLWAWVCKRKAQSECETRGRESYGVIEWGLEK